MAVPVTISRSRLVIDTLPALQVRFYKGVAAKGDIYTQGRFYFLNEDLVLSLYVFEQNPDKASRAEFALSVDGASFLLLRLSPAIADLSVFKEGQRLPCRGPAPAFFKGGDERGWYWGAQLSIPKKDLAGIGLAAAPGAQFTAAVFKTRADEAAYGASFEGVSLDDPYEVASFGQFVAVEY